MSMICLFSLNDKFQFVVDKTGGVSGIGITKTPYNNGIK